MKTPVLQSANVSQKLSARFPIDYDEWLKQFDRFSSSEFRRIQRFSDRLNADVTVVKPIVMVDARSSSSLALAATIESIQNSILQPHSLVVLYQTEYPTELLNTDTLVPVFVMTLDQLTAHVRFHFEHHWVWMPAGVRLAKQALSWLTAEIGQEPSVTCVYTDHDSLDEQGKRVNPMFKPDWSEEMALASGYPGPLLCVSSKSLLDTLKHTHDVSSYELMLYATCQCQSLVKHIPCILWHIPSVLQDVHRVSVDGLQSFLQGQGREAQVSKDSVSKGLRVHYPIPGPAPLVSIIIPTRDRLDLIQPCIKSILSLTTYQNIEVLILDNQSQEPSTLDFFMHLASDSRVKVVPFDHPFNYAAINNYAMNYAQGSILCLLNNDTEIVTPNWLDEMVACLLVQGVGVVGAQLRYPDGRLQHAGDLIGGNHHAGHLHGKLDKNDLGYMKRVVLRQEVSAVTAACLVTHKKLYESVGGLDENKFKVAFNDVDYCLKVRNAGYKVIYTPYAKLIHHESESRKRNPSLLKKLSFLREVFYFRRKWRHVMMNDPFYNPNLNYYRCDFSLDPSPVIKKPWD